MATFKFSKCATLLAGLLSMNGAFADDWKLEMDQDGVKLYTKDGEHSAMKTFKVTTNVNASLSEMVALLNDVKNLPNWMDKVSTAQKLEPLKDHENLVYTVVKAPWPAKDQDNILYSQWKQDPNTYEMVQTVMAEPDHLEPSKGKIRQNYYKAEWRLQPMGNGTIHVTYTAEVDPGTKRIPKWMSDMFVYEMPVKTMHNLTAMTFDSYTGAVFAYVNEPVDTIVATAVEE